MPKSAEYHGDAYSIRGTNTSHWQEFYLWVRSALKVENHIPDWLAEILNERCAFGANAVKCALKFSIAGQFRVAPRKRTSRGTHFISH
jgi:hypothetical protein